jgi:hypothetical protein
MLDAGIAVPRIMQNLRLENHVDVPALHLNGTQRAAAGASASQRDLRLSTPKTRRPPVTAAILVP